MKKNRLAALLLALVLMASAIPMTAFAAPAFKVGDKVQVTASYLRYRKGPGVDTPMLTQYIYGTKCTVLEVSPKGLWFRCSMPDGRTDGWFWGGYLIKIVTDTSTSAAGDYVISNRGMFVNLRASAGGAVLTKVPDGAKVHVMSAANGWSHVKYGSFTGFMMSHFLVKK